MLIGFFRRLPLEPVSQTTGSQCQIVKFRRHTTEAERGDSASNLVEGYLQSLLGVFGLP